MSSKYTNSTINNINLVNNDFQNDFEK